MGDNLEYTIGLEVAKALRSLREFQTAMTQLVPAVNSVRGSIQGLERTASGGSGGLMAMASGVKAMLLPLAAAAAGFEGLRFVADQFKESISQAANFEQLRVEFSVLLQSGQKAKEMLSDLTKFADTTPMQLPELAQAARTLLAFGEPARSVMKDLRQLGDIAAGVQAPIGEIAELFGKARTEGTLFSIDIRELTRRGIPIIGELAKQFHVSENAVRDLAETGRIKFADLQTAIGNLTGKGGMFFGMLTAQGQTFNGMVSTMKDAVGALYREFGAPILEPLKGGIGGITNILAGWKEKAQEWGTVLANVLKGALAIIQNGDAGATLGAALQLGFAKAVNTLYKGAMATVAALVTGLSAGLNVLINALASPSVWKLIGDSLAVAGYTLVAIIQKGIADAIRNIPGMEGAADAMDTAAVSSGMQAKIAQQAVQKDLKTSDVKDTLSAAGDAIKAGMGVFAKTFTNTKGPFDEEKPGKKLAGNLADANARNAPKLPVFIDAGTGNPYGPGAPFGSPDSQMPPDRTAPAPGDLNTEWSNMYRGLQSSAPGGLPARFGTINGKPVGDALRKNAGPLGLAMSSIPSLNERAQAFVGSSGPKMDPQLALATRMLAEILAATRDNKPRAIIPGSGF